MADTDKPEEKPAAEPEKTEEEKRREEAEQKLGEAQEQLGKVFYTKKPKNALTGLGEGVVNMARLALLKCSTLSRSVEVTMG